MKIAEERDSRNEIRVDAGEHRGCGGGRGSPPGGEYALIGEYRLGTIASFNFAARSIPRIRAQYLDTRVTRY